MSLSSYFAVQREHVFLELQGHISGSLQYSVPKLMKELWETGLWQQGYIHCAASLFIQHLCFSARVR